MILFKRNFCLKIFSGLLLNNNVMVFVEVLQMPLLMMLCGHLFGEKGLIVLDLFMSVLTLALFVSSFISLGTTYSFSEEVGKFNLKRAHQIFSQGFIASLIAGVFIYISLFFFSSSLIVDEVREDILVFKKYYLFYMSFLPLCFLLKNICFAGGNSKVIISSSVIEFISPFIVPLLTYKTLGIKSIAIGCLIGLFFSVLLCSFHCWKKSQIKISLYFKIKDFFKISVPGLDDSYSYLTAGLTLLFFSPFLVTHFSEKSVILLSIIISIECIVSFFDAIGGAVAPILEVYQGEQNFLGIKKILNIGIKTACFEAILANILLFIFPDQFVRLFDVQQDDLFEQAVFITKIMSFSFLWSAILSLFSLYYLMIRKIGLMILISTLTNFAFLVPCMEIVALKFGLRSIGYGYVLASILTFIVVAGFVYFRYGKKNFPYLLEKSDTNSYLYDLNLNPTEIVDLRKKVAILLRERAYSDELVYKIQLLIEELFCLIREKNDYSKKILAEFYISFDSEKEIKIILRYNGVLFDITDDQAKITSFSSYFVSSMMEHQKNKKYMETIQYNRQQFSFEV